MEFTNKKGKQKSGNYFLSIPSCNLIDFLAWRKSIITLPILILLIQSCTLQYSSPFECEYRQGDNQTRNELFFDIEIQIPKNWDCEYSTNPDGSRSKVCIDTLALYDALVKTISVTEFPFYQNPSKSLIKKDIQVIKEDSDTDYLNSGIQLINEIPTNWVLHKNQNEYFVIYYLFDTQFKQICISASNTLNEEKICSLINNLNPTLRK